MGRTAYEEHFGCSIAVAISADYQIGLPSGQGGCRFFSIQATIPGLRVKLPKAVYLQSGGAVQPLIECVTGSDKFMIVDAEDNELFEAVADNVYECRLLSNAHDAGSWIIRELAVESGTMLLANAVPLEISLGSGGNGINLRDFARTIGFTDEVPYAIRCTLLADSVIGNEVTTPSFDTGDWPAGSSLLLFLETGAVITGKGGDGGRGGDVPPGLLAQPGLAGGPALVVRLNTALVSYGTIQGGGGGGGGGARNGTQAGGGGGGGCGHQQSIGGNPGTGGGAFNGQFGSLFVAGGGGSGGNQGGQGGAPGGVGSASGAAGGAAGDAIRRLSTVTLTKIRAGTILGAEVTF